MNWWKRITGQERRELIRQIEDLQHRCSSYAYDLIHAKERANLAIAESNKMEKVVRDNSDRVGEWAQEKMRLTHTIETLERKIEEMKKQIRAERRGGDETH